MDTQTFALLHPHTHLDIHIRNNIRPSSHSLSHSPNSSNAPNSPSHSPRPLFTQRNTRILSNVVSSADSSVSVMLGDTLVVVGCKAEVAVPNVLSPNKGFIVPNVDITPLSTPTKKPGPPSPSSQKLATHLSTTLSTIIDLSALVIIPSEAVWCLYIDVSIMNDDGNLLEAMMLGVSRCLWSLNLPDVQVQDGVVRVIDSSTTTPTNTTGIKLGKNIGKNLLKTSIPLAVSFGLYQSDTSPPSSQTTKHIIDRVLILPDLSSFEESVIQNRIEIVLIESSAHTNNTNNNQVSKCAMLNVVSPDKLVTPEIIKRCLEIARERATELVEMVVSQS